MDVIIRGLDQDLHRKFKAEAAMRGISLSKALEEAMKVWLRLDNDKPPLDESEINNAAYEKMKDGLRRRHHGKYVVFSAGKFLGAASSPDEAGILARTGSGRKALVAKIGERRPAGGEWLWSSLELHTA